MSNIRHLNGVAAELFVAQKLTEKGYSILWPQSAQCRYDLVTEQNGTFARIQIKKATWSKNNWYSYLQARISSRNKGSKLLYSVGDFDYFAFTDMERIWLAPFKELEGQTSVCLGSTNPNYKPQTKYKAENWLL